MDFKGVITDIIYMPFDADSMFIKGPLWFLSGIFAIAVKLRRFLYGKGILRSRKHKFKVVSVGGITLGGEGKTTLTLKIAGYFLRRQYKTGVIVGEKAPDEAALIQKSARVSVYTEKRKYIAAEKVRNKDVVIIDDGFQHLALKRDLDIVVIAAGAFNNPYLLPCGPLREPFSTLSKANLVVANNVPPEDREWVLEELSKYKKEEDIFFSNYHIDFFFSHEGKRHPLEFIKDKRVFIFSGIGNPKGFKRIMKDAGALVMEEKVFSDHYHFKYDDLRMLDDLAQEEEMEYLVTTSKDFMRIRHWHGKTPLLVAHLYLVVMNSEMFFKRVEDSIFGVKEEPGEGSEKDSKGSGTK